MEGKPLTPVEEQHLHQAAILATIPPAKIEHVASGKMKLDERLNPMETASQKWIALYRFNWADCLAGVPIVHKSGSSYVIIDGRHRWLARKEMGEAYLFNCEVFSGLQEEQVAALFLYHNSARRNPAPMEEHRAAAASGDPVALRVDEVLSIRGVRNEVGAITACATAVRRGETLDDGQAALDFALRALTDAFPITDKARLRGMLIGAVARVFHVHGSNPKLHYERIVKALNREGRQTADQLIAKAGSSLVGGEGRAAATYKYLVESAKLS